MQMSEDPEYIEIGGLEHRTDPISRREGQTVAEKTKMISRHGRKIAGEHVQYTGRSGRNDDQAMMDERAWKEVVGDAKDITYEEAVRLTVEKELTKNRMGAGISGIIEGYYVGLRQATMGDFQAWRGNRQSHEYESREEFEGRYEEPYGGINRTLAEIDATHRVVPRSEDEWFEWYEHREQPAPRILLEDRRREGSRLDFGLLSTGEQTLVWLAALCYRMKGATDSGGNMLVLLDEMDAGLHAALKRKYITALKILGDLGARVIATTHCPIIVGLSYPEWIHVMETDQNGFATIEPAEKGEAVQQMLGWTGKATPWNRWTPPTEVMEREREGWRIIKEACEYMAGDRETVDGLNLED